MTDLTPATLLDLRASLRWRGQIDLDARTATLITWDAAARVFSLCAYGRVMAQSADIGLLGLMLQHERAEPGFIARVLDPATDPETAVLDPATRAARQSALNAARALSEANAAASEAARRLQAFNPTHVSLDDLEA